MTRATGHQHFAGWRESHILNTLGRFGKSASKNRVSSFIRAYKSWFVPYLRSYQSPNQCRPWLAYLFTDLNCNMDCHYCFSRGKNIPGMPLKTAKDAVLWLQSKGCRVLAFMGGEVLLRKNLILDVTRFAVDRGFFVYLPTNGLLLDRPFIDAVGEAGVAAINLAVDALDGYKGIPKYLNRIRPQFEYLVQREKRYGYTIFFNINITSRNLGDVKQLTETAHRFGIATDYHINEPPHLSYEHFEHTNDGAWISKAQFQVVDELVDWLIRKNRAGYPMVNSIAHLKSMKLFIRSRLPNWPCRAGRSSLVIRLDGTFAPCFELYGTDQDWGGIYEGHKFDTARLQAQKQSCNTHCLSTCNFQVSHYSKSMKYALQWVGKHVHAHVLGVS